MWFDVVSYPADAPWEMAESRWLNLEKKWEQILASAI